MTDTPDPQLQLRLRIALRDREPETNADEFAELVAAVLAFRTLDGALDSRIAQRLGVTPEFVHHYANGVIAPTPAFRREAVRRLRGLAAELGVKET